MVGDEGRPKGDIVRARHRHALAHGGPTPKVSVIIPMLNEAENLPFVLERVDRDYELVLVDGNSRDDSISIGRALRTDARIVQQSRRGKGNALAEGVAASTGEIVVMLDADGSTDPEEIPLFVEALKNGADFAKGSRMIQGGGSEDITRFRRLGNGALTWVANRLFGMRYTDINYGFNAVWRDHWPSLGVDYDGFEIEALMSVRAAKAKLSVIEVASYESSRIHGCSNLSAFGDGWRILKMLVRERFDLSRWQKASVETLGPTTAPEMPHLEPTATEVKTLVS
jgi:glycosyltransferase involved in cell wall biosynthesis